MPKSNTSTTKRCFTRAALLASATKRAAAVSLSGSTADATKNLIATVRSSVSWTADHTDPIPPSPIFLRSRYLPPTTRPVSTTLQCAESRVHRGVMRAVRGIEATVHRAFALVERDGQGRSVVSAARCASPRFSCAHVVRWQSCADIRKAVDHLGLVCDRACSWLCATCGLQWPGRQVVWVLVKRQHASSAPAPAARRGGVLASLRGVLLLVWVVACSTLAGSLAVAHWVALPRPPTRDA